jgi:hypothetical protein
LDEVLKNIGGVIWWMIIFSPKNNNNF